MYQLRKASPPTSKKVDNQFVGVIRDITVGEAFDFPVDMTLKNPMGYPKALAKRFGNPDARYRWVLDSNLGTGTVYRVK